MDKDTISSEIPQNSRPRKQPSFSSNPTKLIFVTVSSIVLLAVFVYICFGQVPALHEPDSAWEPVEYETADHECPLPTARYSIQTAQAACYPSSGGIWMTELGPLELEHLGIARFKSTERSSSQADEDAFCHELRKFGGSWYNPESGKDLFVGGSCHELDEFEPALSIERKVGFPKDGGVWVLGIDEETGRYPAEIVIVRNALTMEERCTALEKLGAEYCDNITECSFFDDLSI